MKKEGEEAAAAEIRSLEEELSQLRKDADSDRVDKEKKITELKAGIEKAFFGKVTPLKRALRKRLLYSLSRKNS